MIWSERGSSGALEMSWFQARWSSSDGASAATSLPGRGKTPHFDPSEPGGLSAEGACAAKPITATASAASGISLREDMRPPA